MRVTPLLRYNVFDEKNIYRRELFCQARTTIRSNTKSAPSVIGNLLTSKPFQQILYIFFLRIVYYNERVTEKMAWNY